MRSWTKIWLASLTSALPTVKFMLAAVVEEMTEVNESQPPVRSARVFGTDSGLGMKLATVPLKMAFGVAALVLTGTNWDAMARSPQRRSALVCGTAPGRTARGASSRNANRTAGPPQGLSEPRRRRHPEIGAANGHGDRRGADAEASADLREGEGEHRLP